MHARVTPRVSPANSRRRLMLDVGPLEAGQAMIAAGMGYAADPEPSDTEFEDASDLAQGYLSAR